MNINNGFSSAIFICFVLLSTVNSLPFIFGNRNGNRRVIQYQSPPDTWNITSVPRSITPHLMVKYNGTDNHIMSGRRSDAEINNDTIKYLKEMKVCAGSVYCIPYYVICIFLRVTYFQNEFLQDGCMGNDNYTDFWSIENINHTRNRQSAWRVTSEVTEANHHNDTLIFYCG